MRNGSFKPAKLITPANIYLFPTGLVGDEEGENMASMGKEYSEVSRSIAPNPDFPQLYFSILKDQVNGDGDLALYDRCGKTCSWLFEAAKLSRAGEHVNAFGFNGTSYDFFENVVKQITELGEIICFAQKTEDYKRVIREHSVGHLLTHPEIKSSETLAQESRVILTRILDKVDILQSNVERQYGQKLGLEQRVEPSYFA